MYTLTCEGNFDAAHFLKGYPGKCANIHGHRWVVLLEIASDALQEEGAERGMAMDFAVMKKALKAECDQLDHTLIMEEGSLKANTLAALQEEDMALSIVPFRPTAENLAKYFFDRMAAQGIPVSAVTVYESPVSSARYSR